jgi:L-aspartate oxidase
MNTSSDVLVIGSGIAGLTYALKAARHGSVLLVTKKARAETNTNYARGGLAAVLGDDDDMRLHVADTLEAGAGLCHLDVVRAVVAEGPVRVRELMDWGTAFDRDSSGRLRLGREGGHSRRRIVHAGDRTGHAIEHALLEAVEREPAITVLEDHLAVDLLLGEDPSTRRPVCRGILALDHRLGRLVVFRTRVVFLASGGCGQVYRHTTNPAIATGDGTAMAYRAGAVVSNMEFIQFHPTALHPTEDPAFLISEAVRGEGAVLVRRDGTSFMERYHPRASLAPRDVVARAIDQELRETGDAHVLLDISAIPRDAFQARFPGAAEGLAARGCDPWADGIPVVPAAHYACGGARTDLYGRTSLPGLYAAGEVACTGLHGANRLASNSLLEAVVLSHRAAEALATLLPDPRVTAGEEWLPGGADPSGLDGRAAGTDTSDPELTREREKVRSLMWDRVGIVRSDRLLDRAEEGLATLAADHGRRWCEDLWTPDLVELRNLLHTAELIVACARARRESRGLHYTLDHPHRNNESFLRDTDVTLGAVDLPFPLTPGES